MGLQPSAPGNGGIELEGYGAKVKAHGRNALIVFGFLIMAGAVLYDGWLNRIAMTAQTELLTQVMVNQRTFIERYVNQASTDHIELKTMCLRERFLERQQPMR